MYTSLLYSIQFHHLKNYCFFGSYIAFYSICSYPIIVRLPINNKFHLFYIIIQKKGSKHYFWSLLLFKLIREFKPLNSVELGTCLGISGAYQAAAQKLNKSGRLITLEGAKSLASLAEKNLQKP